MKLLFIMPLSYSIYPFQIASLSSFLKVKNHQVSYIELVLKKDLDEFNKSKLLHKIEVEKPDLIGISSYQVTFGWVKQISSFIKSKFDIPIIVGGYHATLSPEEVINYSDIDMICLGEGEYPLLELLDRIQRGASIDNIKNIWFKKNGNIIKNNIRPLVENLDELPFMDRDIFDYQKLLNLDGKKRFLAIMGSRGCPFGCSNCSNHSLKEVYPNKNKYVRLRSVDNIIEEIELSAKKYSFEGVSFEDDTFTLFQDWLEEFCRKYKKKIGLSFKCNARPENAKLENMKLLKEAGCECISIGIESGDEKIRKEVLRRRISNRQIERAFRNAKMAGLKVRSFNMVGLPYETHLSLMKTIWLNFKLSPHQVQTTVYYPFRGTDLGELCYKNKWINFKRQEKLRLIANDSILDLPNISRTEIRLAKWINSITAIKSGNWEIIRLALRMLKQILPGFC